MGDIFTNFFSSFFSAAESSIFLVGIIYIMVLYVIMSFIYKATTYYKLSKKPLLSVICNKGSLGEYKTYKKLREYEKIGAKFLFNVYVPKGEDGTTEIDVLMITKKGLFVFESKNYNGWIFGDENNYQWCQILPMGKGKSRKETFYNPIKQNDTHIKFLKELLDNELLMHSFIVFSEKCTLKKVNVTRSDVKVVKRNGLLYAVNQHYKTVTEDVLNEQEINAIFEQLLPFMQVSEATKQEHIDNIKAKYETTTKQEINALDKSEEACANEGQTQPEVIKQESQIQTEKQERVCPKCGSHLVLRKARKGKNAGNEFWGCSNFPRYRYIENYVP